MADATDERFLAAAIRLGSGALGTAWPNPAVGAILVKDGMVVGRGRTAPGGRPHAEPQALDQAGDAARGATLYVSLEPCAHHGRTPPCAEALVAAGVSRVVAALADPDPRVDGGGFARLRRAGIEVDIRPSEAARRAQAGHLSRIRRARPHVTLKLAISADGAIGKAGEGQVTVTGEIARRHVQALRTRYDAILVGRGTVEADDPQLTVRLSGLEDRSPVRIVLDSGARLSGDRRVFDGKAPTWVLVADAAAYTADPECPPGVDSSSPQRGEVDRAKRRPGEGEPATSSYGPLTQPAFRHLALPRAEGGLDLAACLRRLATEGVTRLLVEGGARVARSFLEADLVDEAIVFRSPAALGAGGLPALAGLPLSTIEASAKFRRIERRRFGDDTMTHYERSA